jgi:hypothetical protein
MGSTVKKSWREASKGGWVTTLDPATETLTNDQINSGSFMRIADSMEIIAKDKHRLEQDLQYWKESSKRKDGEISLLNNKIRGYKGRITTLMGEIARTGKLNKS